MNRRKGVVYLTDYLTAANDSGPEKSVAQVPGLVGFTVRLVQVQF